MFFMKQISVIFVFGDPTKPDHEKNNQPEIPSASVLLHTFGGEKSAERCGQLHHGAS